MPAMPASTSPLSFDVAEQMAKRARWTPLEIAFWVAAFATIYFLPERHLILTEIAIWALFALSLDLILGYGGILSLGHAAFFGIGAYAAGLFAQHGIITEPGLGLVAAGAPPPGDSRPPDPPSGGGSEPCPVRSHV